MTTENNEQESFCKGITKDDCCLFITYDKNESYKACLKILFQKRCKIIVITSNCDNPLVKYSNYHIIIPHKEKLLLFIHNLHLIIFLVLSIH